MYTIRAKRREPRRWTTDGPRPSRSSNLPGISPEKINNVLRNPDLRTSLFIKLMIKFEKEIQSKISICWDLGYNHKNIQISRKKLVELTKLDQIIGEGKIPSKSKNLGKIVFFRFMSRWDGKPSFFPCLYELVLR